MEETKEMMCPDCHDRVMKIVFWDLLAKGAMQEPILVVYQCEDCKRVDIKIE